MSERRLVFAGALVIFFALAILNIVLERRLAANPKEVGWALYFDHPKQADAVFSIDSPDSTSVFFWELLSDQRVIGSGEIMVMAGEKNSIFPDFRDTGWDDELLVRVRSEKGETREIVKKLNR